VIDGRYRVSAPILMPSDSSGGVLPSAFACRWHEAAAP
jgi:hypothetical protein